MSDPIQPASQAAETSPQTDPRQAVIDKYYTPTQTQDGQAATQADPAKLIADTMKTMSDKIVALEGRLQAAMTPPLQAHAQSAQTEEGAWLKLLSEGKRSEGEAALAAVLGPQIQDRAVQQALSLMQAERTVTEYVTAIRSANPDLAEMEPYIAAAAQQRIVQAQHAGRVKSPGDYVNVYKEAVNAEIENARQLTARLRGVGAQTVTNRFSEVRGQGVLPSNSVDQNRGQTQTQTEAPITMDNLNADYMARRNQQHLRNVGLATA